MSGILDIELSSNATWKCSVGTFICLGIGRGTVKLSVPCHPSRSLAVLVAVSLKLRRGSALNTGYLAITCTLLAAVQGLP